MTHAVPKLPSLVNSRLVLVMVIWRGVMCAHHTVKGVARSWQDQVEPCR